MASLSQVTGETRVILKWAGIILGAILLIFVITRIIGIIFPKPAPPPTVSFGKIDAIEFPQGNTDKKLNYAIDTLSGNLPQLPTQLKVYKMQGKDPDLLALVRAQEKVENTGFSQSPQKLSESIYQWRDSDSPERTLTMNILTSNFNMISSFLLDSKTLTFNATNESLAIQTARSFLSSLNLFPDDIDTTKTKTALFSIKNFGLVPATSLSNAQVIQVNFYQKNVDNLPVYYARSTISPINLLVAEILRTPQVVEANYSYQKPSSENATYPIKTASQALNELEEGKAYIVSHFGEDKVLIKNVTLGYYIGDKTQDYLYPIIVFEGNNGFLAYVEAVTDEWVNK